VINPSISSSWKSCRLSYRVPDGKTRYEIRIENPSGAEHGVKEASIDGQPLVVQNGIARVPIVCDAGTHRVVVRL
jgi:cyclic beta-1,2-glucan synthetase